MGEKIRVGLVYGGRSGEHEVSLQTAFSVMQALDYDKYEIRPFYITKQGIWHAGPALTAPPEHIGLIRYDQADGASESVSTLYGQSGEAGRERKVISLTSLANQQVPIPSAPTSPSPPERAPKSVSLS